MIFKKVCQAKTKLMAENLREKFSKKKRPKKRFIAVNLWRAEFGEVSVKAIYDIYSQKFNVDPKNMKKYSFPHCVNALRKLENPEYVAPKYGSNE